MKYRLMKDITKGSPINSLIDVSFVLSESGEANLKYNVSQGDIISTRNNIINYKLEKSEINFESNNTEIDIKEFKKYYDIINNTIYSNFSLFLNNIKSDGKNIKWYLPDNKFKKWCIEKLQKLNIINKTDVSLIENEISNFFKDKKISNKRLIVISPGIYKILQTSILFKKSKYKNQSIYFGGKIGEISIWVNTYSPSQSMYMFNDHNFSLILNDNIDYDFIKNGIDNGYINFTYQYQFLNNFDNDCFSINLIEY